MASQDTGARGEGALGPPLCPARGSAPAFILEFGPR